MIRWMCGVKLRDKLSCVELRQQLGIEDMVKVVQRNRLRWYGNVLRKDDDDWLKKCITLEVEEARQRGKHRKRLWTSMWMICTKVRMLLGRCKRRRMIRGTEAMTVISRAKYELYVSGAVLPRLTWIYGLLNEFVFVCLRMM